ncbi:hypothetical protein X975_19697, partial [Stegodyphus mimosarum]
MHLTYNHLHQTSLKKIFTRSYGKYCLSLFLKGYTLIFSFSLIFLGFPSN